MVERLLTARDVETLGGVPLWLVYRDARSGALPSLRLGRLRRFRAMDVDVWLAQPETFSRWYSVR